MKKAFAIILILAIFFVCSACIATTTNKEITLSSHTTALCTLSSGDLKDLELSTKWIDSVFSKRESVSTLGGISSSIVDQLKNKIDERIAQSDPSEMPTEFLIRFTEEGFIEIEISFVEINLKQKIIAVAERDNPTYLYIKDCSKEQLEEVAKECELNFNIYENEYIENYVCLVINN